MWKLWHRLFGFHYVSFIYGYDRQVSRLRWTPNGQAYVKCCGEIMFLDEIETLKIRHLTWSGPRQ